MAETGGRSRNLLHWATGLAFAAVGATFVYDRKKKAEHGEAPDSEFAVGRGEPSGGLSLASREAGYEIKDARVRDLALVMGVSVTIMVIGVGSVFYMYGRFDRHFQSSTKDMTSISRTTIVPPLPRLQADPYRDIDAVIMEQERRLATYGWNSPAHTSAHIPIVRAMQQVIGKPLDNNLSADAAGPPGSKATPPVMPAYNAAQPQEKPGNRIQGEGRPGAIAPSYNPAPTKPADSK